MYQIIGKNIKNDQAKCNFNSKKLNNILVK